VNAFSGAGTFFKGGGGGRAENIKYKVLPKNDQSSAYHQ